MRHCKNIFSGEIFNYLHEWIENHPHVIHSLDVKESLFVKIISTLLNKQKDILQISVQDLHMIFPISQGIVLVQEQLMGKYVLEIHNIGST